MENVDNPDYNERDPTKYKHKCNRCTRRYQKLSHLERHALKCVSKEILIIFESCFNRTFLIHVTGWHCSSVIETNVAKESRWPFLMCRARFVFPVLVYIQYSQTENLFNILIFRMFKRPIVDLIIFSVESLQQATCRYER